MPRPAVEMLRERGYDAAGVVEEGMRGWKDHVLWQAVQGEGRLLVTADKGFADIRRYQPGTHAGVLLLRPDQDGIRPVIQLLERFLAVYDLETAASTLTVVTPRSIRMRR